MATRQGGAGKKTSDKYRTGPEISPTNGGTDGVLAALENGEDAIDIIGYARSFYSGSRHNFEVN